MILLQVSNFGNFTTCLSQSAGIEILNYRIFAVSNRMADNTSLARVEMDFFDRYGEKFAVHLTDVNNSANLSNELRA